MKINFQQIMHSTTPIHTHFMDSEAISIIVPYESQSNISIQKQLYTRKNKNNIQETMADLLETSLSFVQKRDYNLNNSFERSFSSETTSQNDFFIRQNYKQRYTDLKARKIKDDLLKSVEKIPKQAPKANIHQTLYSQSTKNLRLKTKQLIELKQIEYRSKAEAKKVTNSNIGKKLYSQHKKSKIHNELRSRMIKYSMKEQKQCTFHPKLIETPKYLQNYRPLLERLQQQVQKRQQQDVFVKYYKNIDFTDDNSQMFKPAINRRSKDTKSRVFDFMNRSQEIIKVQQDKISLSCQSSSNLTNRLNKSIQIVKGLEQSYFTKITDKLFNDNDRLKISAQVVSRLSQKQFQILFPLIQSIEKNNELLTKSQFFKKLISFFKKLPVHHKHALTFLHRSGQHYQYNNYSRSNKNTPSIGSKSKKIGDNYLCKLQKYV